MSGILIDLCLPTADTIVHNARFLFDQLFMAHGPRKHGVKGVN